MSRCRFSILALVIALLMASCATSTYSTYYGTKLPPVDIGVVSVRLDDSEDNSELRGNQFLERKILAAVAARLQRHGMEAIVDVPPGSGGVTHLLILKSNGVLEETTHVPVTTTQVEQTGFDADGGMFSYSTPVVSGGGAYTTTQVCATVTLFSVEKSGDITEVCRSYVKEINPFPGNLEVKYLRTFADAAVSVFDVK